jgi:hypothetical protein
MDPTTHLIFTLMFLGAGFIPIIAIKHFKKEKIKLNRWNKVMATITAIRSEKGSDSGRRFYYPKYQYFYGGRDYQGTSSMGVSGNKYKVNTAIEVRVNPLNPEESDILHYTKIAASMVLSLDLVVFVFTCMSVLAFAVGLGSIIWGLLK